ncbi:tRNA (guanosine(37)-N1)-methyltransferase TrmD [Candidatus Falkowbacteria bacterium]|nr:tRNA (guanosine(37)-N1)-methyltransferase TrmD [Candidatus Falkowbacteria bacterium]
MLQFDIITIFPKSFDSYFSESIISRGQKKKLIKIDVHDLRKWTEDKRKTVDDKPYGGGPGMVLKVEPLAKALRTLKLKVKSVKCKVILFSAGGKQFDNAVAAELAEKYNRLILICGHYEGVDERVKKIIKDLGFEFFEISIGPYVLTGGELPAMVLADAVARQIPGVLGKIESLEEKRLGVGVPAYTRPEIFTFKNKKYQVPKVLLSGDNKKIEEWRLKRIKK